MTIRVLNGMYCVLLKPFLREWIGTVSKKVALKNYGEEDQDRLISFCGLWGCEGTYMTIGSKHDTFYF